MTTIAVVNHSTVVSDAQVAQACLDINTQIVRDFAPAWHYTASLVPKTPGAGDWLMVIADDSDQAGALGYHEDPKGVPTGFVFARTDAKYGLSWTVTFSHEVLEMLGDPKADAAIKVGRGKWAAKELCDPCEADGLGYKIGQTLVSDFLLPAWFAPKAAGPFTFNRTIGRPLALVPGGYMSWWSPLRGWYQTQARTAGVSRVVMSRRHSRRVS